jgi:hypothetical protein
LHQAADWLHLLPDGLSAGLGLLLVIPVLGLTRGWRVPGLRRAPETVQLVEPTTWEIRSANTASVFNFLLRNAGPRTAYKVVVGDADFECELGEIGPRSEGFFTVNRNPAYGVLVTVTWNETDEPSGPEFSWTGGPSGPSGR